MNQLFKTMFFVTGAIVSVVLLSLAIIKVGDLLPEIDWVKLAVFGTPIVFVLSLIGILLTGGF